MHVLCTTGVNFRNMSVVVHLPPYCKHGASPFIFGAVCVDKDGDKCVDWAANGAHKHTRAQRCAVANFPPQRRRRCHSHSSGQ